MLESKIVILNIFYRNRNKDEKNKIEEALIKKGLIIHSSDEIDKGVFGKSYILEKIEKIKEIYGNNVKIILFSNIKDLSFFVFRFFNGIISSVIYFIEKYNYSILSNEIERKISEMKNIEQENLSGGIYLNINYHTLEKIDNIIEEVKKLEISSKFRMLDELLESKEINDNEEEKSGKKYLFRNESIENYNESSKERLIINLDQNSKNVNINEMFLKFNNNFDTFILFFAAIFLNKDFDKEYKKLIDIYLKFLIKKGTNRDRENFAKNVKKFSDVNNNFLLKMRLLSSLTELNEINEDLMKCFVESIKKDRSMEEIHIYYLISSLYLEAAFGVKGYNEYPNDCIEIIDRLSDKYTKTRTIIKRGESNNKIAIITDQLVMPTHSTAKAILDYAINIRRVYPEKKVKIFTEEYFWYQKNFCEEYCFAYSKSPYSSQFEEQHKEYLRKNKAEDIEIIYLDQELNIDKKIEFLLRNIEEYNPEVIININNSYSLAQKILSKYYKMVYLTFGLVNFQQNCEFDFYFTEDIIKKYDKILHKYRILKTNAIEFVNKPKKNNREYYFKELNENDFILITVGLRLKAELDSNEAFVRELMGKIIENERYKWILVGGEKSQILINDYSEWINKKIFFIDYEENLSDLYQNCNIYINPPRIGGGYSIAEAMFYGLPVLSLKSSEAGKAWIGEENCVDNAYEYNLKIEKLFKNKEYYSDENIKMKRIIDKLNFRSHIKEIFSFIKT